MINSIDTSGLIFECVFNFSYMLAWPIALRKTTGHSQKSPEHQFSLESEEGTAEDDS